MRDCRVSTCYNAEPGGCYWRREGIDTPQGLTMLQLAILKAAISLNLAVNEEALCVVGLDDSPLWSYQ